jgi:hypothetical protein
MADLDKIINELEEFYSVADLDIFAQTIVDNQVNFVHAYEWLLEKTKEDYKRTPIEPNSTYYAAAYLSIYYGNNNTLQDPND